MADLRQGVYSTNQWARNRDFGYN